MLSKNPRGYTLLEMCIVIAIMMIAVLIGIPTTHLLDKTRADTEIERLFHLIQLGRNEAIWRNQPVVLCASSDGQQCGGEWTQGMVLFVDTQGNHQIHAVEDVLRVQAAVAHGTLSWHSFGAQHYVRFTPYGWSNQQNGTFMYCGEAKTTPQMRGIIISTAGRPRFAAQTQQGGIIDAHGKEVRCY